MRGKGGNSPMIAILSDVHANLEALTAVIRDMSGRKITRIFFLGDIIGYGPNPVEVLEFLQKFEFCLMGNHDRAVLTGPPKKFNPVAKEAVEWTRKQIHPSYVRLKWLRPWVYRKRLEWWRFLLQMKPIRKEGDWVFCHDHPIQPGSDKYVHKLEVAQTVLDGLPDIRAFFIGHSHVPMMFTYKERIVPEEGTLYPIDQRLIVNVGSVGQPRDRDARACYVLLDERGIQFIRVPYDIRRTQQKIRQAGLPQLLAQRLEEGK
ncbi:MAG: metallophosphoesterase family protein [Planctomycetes bacterium]|nr:metallophosphoesterase family protein [Planctomycetota bacterium]